MLSRPRYSLICLYRCKLLSKLLAGCLCIIVRCILADNTLAAYHAVAKGVTDAGKEAEIVFVSSASIDELKSETAFALGCPAMGAEVLEEGEMEPFVTDLEGSVAGKTIGLFGSYGWGDGEWMRTWESDCDSAGVNLVCESVICTETPDDAALEACRALGKALVE